MDLNIRLKHFVLLLLMLVPISFSYQNSIKILNPHSYPVLHGYWIINFTTKGKNDLTISAVNGTYFNYDLEFDGLYCNEKKINVTTKFENPINNVWINGMDGKIIKENFYCDGISRLKIKILQTGIHTLKFEFGNSTAYAHNYADCTGTSASPCHKCDVSNMKINITAPNGQYKLVYGVYSSSSGSCSSSSSYTTETWVNSSVGYTFCPVEGQYKASISAYSQGNSYAWEDWSSQFNIYTVNYDSNSNWCSCKGGTWFSSVSGGSNGNCCGDDGSNDNFYYNSSDPATATSLTCERCDAGTYHSPVTLYGNGYKSGTTCYYGDITCTASSASNGASCTLKGDETCVADVGCVDSTPPTTTISPDGHSWTRDDVSFTLSCSDSGSGCDTTYYKIINDGDTCPAVGSYTSGTSGTVTCPAGSACNKSVCYYSTDNAGNTETVKKSDTFLIDKIAPTYDFTSLEGCDYFNSSSNTCYMLPGHTFNVTIQHHDFNSTPYRQYLTFTNTTCTPNGCGCSWGQECPSGNEIKSYVNVDSDSFTDAMWNDSYLDINSSVCDYPEGCSGYYARENWSIKAGSKSKMYRIWTYMADQAYNGVGYTLTGYYVLVDNVAPSTSISPNGHSWTKSDVSFTLSCSDSGSGCNQTYYSIINDGDTCPATDDPSYTNSTAGTVTCPSGSVCQKRVCYYSVDNVGNVESVHQSNVFYIDKIAPSATISPDGQTCGKDVSFTLSCSDSGSGCGTTYYKIINDGDTCPAVGSYTSGTSGTVSCPAGSACQKRVCYYSTDNVGNIEAVHQSNVFYIDNAPPTSAELRPENRSVVTNGNFSWTTSNDVGCAGLDKYEFQVSTDGDFNNIICSESTAGNNAQCDLENKRIYYVRLRENDSLSNTNDWVTSAIYVDKPVEDHIITIGMEGTNANIPYKNYNWIMFPADLNHYYVCFDGTTITGLIFDGDVFRFIQNGTGGKYYISQNYNGNDLIIPLYHGSCASIDDYISEIEKGIQITSFSLPKHGIAQVIYMIVKLPFNASGNVHFGRGNHKLVIERTSDGLKLYRG